MVLYTTLPADWCDTPVKNLAGGAQVLVTKLRNRSQGLEEATTTYCYDVFDLCIIVNPIMAKSQRLEFLFRGLRPTLLEKIHPLRPKTCAEFLEMVQILTKATLMANRRG